MVIAEQKRMRKKQGVGKKKGAGGNAKRTEGGIEERMSERGRRREKGKAVIRGKSGDMEQREEGERGEV